MGLQYQSRRSFLDKAVELVATVPLIGLIVENFRNRTSYYEIDSSQAQILESSRPTLDEITKQGTPLEKTLDTLNFEYEKEYYKSHVGIVHHIRPVDETATITLEPETATITLEPETYYTWEEPSNVPKHDIVNGWNNFHMDFSNKIRGLCQGATIDLEKLRELTVSRQTTGQGREGLVSLAIYAPQIAALLFYEEAIAEIKYGYEMHSSTEELVDKHNTQHQITRRSFFKVGAALAGAFASLPIVDDNRKRRKEGKVRLEGEIEQMKALREISGTESFFRYFRISPTQLIEQYREQIELSQQALQTGIKEEGVRAAFLDFVKTGNRFRGSLENLFKDGVPEDMSEAIKSTLIAQSLRDKSTSEHRAVYNGIGLTGLAVAGAIAATLIPLELANGYFANRFEKNPSKPKHTH